MEFVQINDETFSFNWVGLTPKARSILKYLQYKSRENKYVFPSIPRMAKICNCAQSTVKKWIATFIEWNWLSRYKRPYQSNLYTLITYLIEVDLESENFLANKSAPIQPTDRLPNRPVLDNKHKTCTKDSPSGTGTEERSGTIDEGLKERLRLLKDLKLFEHEKLELARKLTLNQLAKAMEDVRDWQKWGNPFRDLKRYVECAAEGWKKRKNTQNKKG